MHAARSAGVLQGTRVPSLAHDRKCLWYTTLAVRQRACVCVGCALWQRSAEGIVWGELRLRLQCGARRARRGGARSSSQASCGRAPAPLRLRWRWPAQCVPAARGYFPAPLRPSCRGRSTWRRSTGRGRSACAASWKTCSCGRVRRGRCRRRRLTMVSERSLGVDIGALVHLMGCRAAQSGSRARARSRRKVDCRAFPDTPMYSPFGALPGRSGMAGGLVLVQGPIKSLNRCPMWE